MVEPADVFTVISPLADVSPLHDQRGRPELRMLEEIMRGAWNELRNIEPLVRDQARAWFLAGDVGLVTCMETCDFLSLEYDLVRALALAGHRLPKLRGNPAKGESRWRRSSINRKPRFGAGAL